MEDETMFDFEDGNGPVPAHRHRNGGGWVADSATVAPTVSVEEGALVYGGATVCDTVRLGPGTRVYGRALLEGSLILYRGAVIDRTPIIVTNLFEWSVVLIKSPERMVAIGCEVYMPEHWRKHAPEIARRNSATPGSVPKLMTLLDLVYGKPRKPRAKKKS